VYSIFHTSHCGSTLLACLLSKSVATLTEPKWSHDIRFVEGLEDKVKLVKNNHKENTLVKYPSLVCEIAPFIDGKKVFLYKNFEDHLCKMRAVHGKSDKDHAMFWCFRFANLIKAKDVLFIECNYFLNNQQQVAKEVCNWFGIDYVPVEINFHVKQAGYNHRDEPIKI
jgi:hypothetical protein